MMQKCNTLNIVTNSNGIVRIYGDGGMVFEIQANYVKTESFVDCDKPAVSGTVQKSKQEQPKKSQPWVIGHEFCATIDGVAGIFKCLEYNACKGYLMLGLTEGVRNTEHWVDSLAFCRSHQPAEDKGSYWQTKLWPTETPIKVPKDSISAGRIAIDDDEIPQLSAEEKYRLANFEDQPEARYFK